MDNANEDLSKRLHEVLDAIGVSEYTRKKYWEVAMFHEISLMFKNKFYENMFVNKISFYQVGSICEGTTTPDLKADIDLLCCHEDWPVVDNAFESKQHGLSCLILDDKDTKPGYVRLQFVNNRRPLSIGMNDVSEFDGSKFDLKGRLCITHPQIIAGRDSYRNGPADTYLFALDSRSLDLVYALRCRHIPRSANYWLNRIRKYDWPSQKQLKAMGSYGCFFVGVGHPQSHNKSMEWRMSFSLQERDLMSSLNETQHKCYILLKMIKRDIIESKAGDSISSYHCKTSLFYTIESSNIHIWKDGNLILCVRLCLKRILNWVKAKMCPNYFIPEENMFDKLSPKTLHTIETILIDIFESGVNFLYALSCESVGELLKYKMCGSELVCSLNKSSTISQPRFVVIDPIIGCNYTVRKNYMRLTSLSYDTLSGYTNGVKKLLLYLQHTNYVKEHTTKDVRMTLDYIKPNIQLQYEQCLFSQYLKGGDLSGMWSNIFQNVISGTSSDIDLISSKLSLASLYIQSEHLGELCKCILLACEHSLEPYVISVCGCEDHLFHSNPALAEQIQFTNISNKYVSRHFTTGCMVFHESQVRLVHTVLHYETFRNVYTKSDSASESRQEYWLNWITVDSKIYLYFLQYLFYSKNKNESDKETAVQKLKHVLNTDNNLGHKETGNNLLGWICLQDNDVQTAWRYLCLSWKIRPFKNAAKWHMLALLSQLMKVK